MYSARISSTAEKYESIAITHCWDVTPCKLGNRYEHCEVTCRSHLAEVSAESSKTLVTIDQTVRRHILNVHHIGNLKCQREKGYHLNCNGCLQTQRHWRWCRLVSGHKNLITTVSKFKTTCRMFPDYRKQNNNSMNNQQQKFPLCALQNESVKTAPSLENVATENYVNFAKIYTYMYISYIVVHGGRTVFYSNASLLFSER